MKRVKYINLLNEFLSGNIDTRKVKLQSELDEIKTKLLSANDSELKMKLSQRETAIRKLLYDMSPEEVLKTSLNVNLPTFKNENSGSENHFYKKITNYDRDKKYILVSDAIYEFFDFMNITRYKNCDTEFLIQLLDTFVEIKIRFTDPHKFVDGIRITLSSYFSLDQEIINICDILKRKFEGTVINTTYCHDVLTHKNIDGFEILFHLSEVKTFIKYLKDIKENELDIYLSSKKFGL